MSDSDDLSDEVRLIQQFLEGDKRAGDILYGDHQPKLLASVEGLLYKSHLPHWLAEDITQEVWLHLLIGKARRLKGYQPGRAHFDTYLEMLADCLILRLRRSASRACRADIPLEGHDPPDPGGDDALVRAEFAECLEEGLTGQESRYVHEQLLEEPAAALPLSAANARVLKHRVQQKLPDYIAYLE